GTGNGRFENPVAAGGGPADVLLSGDFGGNKRPDIVVEYGRTSVFGRPSIGLLVNSGKGTFTSGFAVSNAMHPGVGDFVSDSMLDLAVVPLSSSAPPQMNVYLGNGDRTFQAPIAISVPAPALATVADLNIDGVADLVLRANSGITVLLNQT